MSLKINFLNKKIKMWDYYLIVGNPYYLMFNNGLNKTHPIKLNQDDFQNMQHHLMSLSSKRHNAT